MHRKRGWGEYGDVHELSEWYEQTRINARSYQGRNLVRKRQACKLILSHNLHEIIGNNAIIRRKAVVK